MASRFAWISKKEILSVNEEAVLKNTKMATKFGAIVFNGKLFNLSSLIFKGQKSKYDALFMKTVECQNHNENNETSDVFQLGFNNKRNLTQPLRK